MYAEPGCSGGSFGSPLPARLLNRKLASWARYRRYKNLYVVSEYDDRLRGGGYVLVDEIAPVCGQIHAWDRTRPTRDGQLAISRGIHAAGLEKTRGAFQHLRVQPLMRHIEEFSLAILYIHSA
jgi:hypothetical protein